MIRAGLLLAVLPAGLAAQEAGWAQVGALFAERCIMCHSGDYAPLGLRLDSYAGALAGSDNGPVLIAGDPAGSALIGRLEGRITPRMPLDGPPFLEPGQIALVAAWIAAGMPEGAPVAALAMPPAPVRPEGQVWFDAVEPILLQRCAKCHSDNGILGAPPEGLRLTTLGQAMAGGERAVIVPGQAALSPLWRHVAGLEHPRMPFDGPPWLTDDEIARIGAWIDGGARDAAGVVQVLPPGTEFRIEGRLTGPDQIDGGDFAVTGDTRIDDALVPGRTYELRAVIGADGQVIATRLRER